MLYIVCSARPAASRLYETKVTLAARIWWLRESGRESLPRLLEATQLWCVVEPSSLAPEFISLTSLLSCLSELSMKQRKLPSPEEKKPRREKGAERGCGL